MITDLRTVGGKLLMLGDETEVWNFGWMPPDNTDSIAADTYWNNTENANRDIVNQEHNHVVQLMPEFKISGSWQQSERRISLWQACKKVLGKHLPYIWQLTGSCVGAGGANMLMTLMCCEIVAGDLEEFILPFWPFTYGISRMLSGMRGRGEGSTGSGWAEAIRKYGIFGITEMTGLPEFRNVDGWLQLTREVELQHSDGNRASELHKELARKHLVKTVAPAKSHQDLVAAATNGYPWTVASSFGMRNMIPPVRGGDNPVRIGTWDGTWQHQTYGDEIYDHPTEGMLIRWGNNWGPDAHGSPTGEEPPGGVYLRAETWDRICRSGEVYIFSAFDGFPARDKFVDWTKF